MTSPGLVPGRFGFIALDAFTMNLGPFAIASAAHLRSESDPARRAIFNGSGFAVSPDGRQVAYWHGAGGRQDLQIFAAASPDPQPSLYSVPIGQLGGGIVWSSDASGLLFEVHESNVTTGATVTSTLELLDLRGTVAPLRTLGTLANGRGFRPLAWDRSRGFAAAGEFASDGYLRVLTAYDIVQTAGEPAPQRTDVSERLAADYVEASVDARFVLGVDVVGGTVRWWPIAAYAAGTTERPRSAASKVASAHWRPGTTEIGWDAEGSIELHDIAQPQLLLASVYKSPDGLSVSWGFRPDGSAVIIHGSVGRGPIPPSLLVTVVDLESRGSTSIADEGIWSVSVRLD